jgi:hypothetical protein
MQIDDLPSPGFVPGAHALRVEAFKAINSARVREDVTKGQADTGEKLREFFLACAEKCPRLVQPEDSKAKK